MLKNLHKMGKLIEKWFHRQKNEVHAENMPCRDLINEVPYKSSSPSEFIKMVRAYQGAIKLKQDKNFNQVLDENTFSIASYLQIFDLIKLKNKDDVFDLFSIATAAGESLLFS